MLGTVRFRSTPVAVLSIVLVLASALGGWHTPDDLDEYVTPAAYGSANHHDAYVSAGAPRPASEHCALCHWLQAMAKAAPVPTEVFAGESFQLIRLGAHRERVRTAARHALSSRAPPLA